MQHINYIIPHVNYISSFTSSQDDKTNFAVVRVVPRDIRKNLEKH